MAGDLVYFVMPVADADKGKAFYGELFGWDFTPGSQSGYMADCKDDQGTSFSIWSPPKEGGG